MNVYWIWTKNIVSYNFIPYQYIILVTYIPSVQVDARFSKRCLNCPIFLEQRNFSSKMVSVQTLYQWFKNIHSKLTSYELIQFKHSILISIDNCLLGKGNPRRMPWTLIIRENLRPLEGYSTTLQEPQSLVFFTYEYFSFIPTQLVSDYRMSIIGLKSKYECLIIKV